MTGECRQLIRSDLGVGGGLGQEVGAGIGQQGRWRLAPRSPTQFPSRSSSDSVAQGHPWLQGTIELVTLGHLSERWPL